MAKNVNLINIRINKTEDKVNWNSCQGKTSAQYSRFRYAVSRVKWRPRRDEDGREMSRKGFSCAYPGRSALES